MHLAGVDKTPDKKRPRFIPEKLTDEEREFVWRNRKGKLIYTPIYEKYNELFFKSILDDFSLETVFKDFGNTSLYERYMLNAAQFSAVKQVNENELLRKAAIMLDDQGNVRPYKEYEKDAREITNMSRDTWLRVEYDNNRRNAVQGAQFRRMEGDADLYPYWQYRGVMDSRERPEHVEMEGKIFRIGDPDSDNCFPPNDWNCRCSADPVDDLFLQENKLTVQTPEQVKKVLENDVDEQFRYNPATQGNMPNTGSYFDMMPSANSGNYQLFNLPPARHMDFNTDLEGFAAKGMHYLMNVMDDWKKDHHVDQNGDIVFQFAPLRTNVRWNNISMHQVTKHLRGFENIPRTVTDPDEVWMSWEDPAAQLVVLRTYIKFGAVCYLVFTRDGLITDAFALSPGSADKYRKGVFYGE